MSPTFPQKPNKTATDTDRKLALEVYDLVSSVPEEGDDACPCLTLDEVRPISFSDFSEGAQNVLGDQLDFPTYGIGCNRHDKDRAAFCRPLSCNNDDCGDTSWCNRAWCWVDPDHCGVLHRRSASYKSLTRYYSYATCREVDTFDAAFKRYTKPLAGRIMRVGFNHNSGGYVGAFSRFERNFDGVLSDWSGPVVDFVLQSAQEGGFVVQVVPPPRFLLNKSIDFFGASRFSYCAYATELGFLDFCVAQYTITSTRAMSAKWATLTPQDLRLIVMNHVSSSSEHLADTLETIFLPFEPSTWYFICLCVIPLLAVLFVVHERGHSGSAYPRSHTVLVDDRRGQHKEVRQVRIPIYRQIIRSIYMGFLSTMQGAYQKKVVSLGARVHLIGISFFILVIVEVYVANLIAILSERAKIRPIESLDDVRDRRLRICSIRTGVETIQAIHRVPGSFFVKDPVELGGDGEPGFNCVTCDVAKRVFDFMDPEKADVDDRYCHVAITQQQDLEVLQGRGIHCNKTFVGPIVGSATTGFPVHAPDVLSFFLARRSEGNYSAMVNAAKPVSQCVVRSSTFDKEAFLEGTAFDISELSGIWVMAFGLACIGLVVSLAGPIVSRMQKKKVKQAVGYDQHGAAINRVRRRDSQISSELEKLNVSFSRGQFAITQRMHSEAYMERTSLNISARSRLNHSQTFQSSLSDVASSALLTMDYGYPGGLDDSSSSTGSGRRRLNRSFDANRYIDLPEVIFEDPNETSDALEAVGSQHRALVAFSVIKGIRDTGDSAEVGVAGQCKVLREE